MMEAEEAGGEGFKEDSKEDDSKTVLMLTKFKESPQSEGDDDDDTSHRGRPGLSTQVGPTFRIGFPCSPP